ncbi:hypothetical protein [Polaromonas sp.]|jgi:hypothetical protein|uniref:hypothetical protein n=1 Tax=Polaromonas sp. TaxID=1869339 RepID=UPI001E19852F|nr:hypothetical protein [Polaromonas sp.]MBT9475904.1 hypothetical protein [Polaromonas sp.]
MHMLNRAVHAVCFIRFVHVHSLSIVIIMVVMAGILAVQCDVFQLDGTLCHSQRAEHGQCLANNGK